MVRQYFWAGLEVRNCFDNCWEDGCWSVDEKEMCVSTPSGGIEVIRFDEVQEVYSHHHMKMLTIQFFMKRGGTREFTVRLAFISELQEIEEIGQNLMEMWQRFRENSE